MAVYLASPGSSRESQNVQDGSGTSNEEPPRDESSSLCPFKLDDSFGLNSSLPLLNLTGDRQTRIAYGCSHAAIIYDYRTRETVSLLGHRNAVTTLSVSRDGRWLVSADSGRDAAVVVWDTRNGVPVCTLFEPHGKDGLGTARISPDARYIVTVSGTRRPAVRLWLWTRGTDSPDGSIEVSEMLSDPVKGIAFNEERSEEFAMTTDRRVLFFAWVNGTEPRYVCPKIVRNQRRLGAFNCTCYVPGTRLAFTATTNGFVLVWNDQEEGGTENNDDSVKSKVKRHVKSVRLQNCDISVLMSHDGTIVTGNSNGRVSFYDVRLRILYWCQNPSFDAIRSIAFHLQPDLATTKLDTEESELDFGDDDEEQTEYIPAQEFFKLTVNLELPLRTPRGIKNFVEPRDASPRRKPFSVQNFFVCTAAGLVALIEVSKLKCHFVLEPVGGSITALDAHPESHYLVAGTSRGGLFLYDYRRRIRVLSKVVPALPDYRPIIQRESNTGIVYVTSPGVSSRLSAVTTLKYSPKCDMLACGLMNGGLWLLHPVTFEPVDPVPYKHSTEAILRLVFTDSAEYMAYTDNALTVAVFKRSHQGLENLWSFLGKYHSHCLPVVDIIFGPPLFGTKTSRLFSLGEDKDLVEYDLEHSGPYPDPGLKILRVDRIEYTAIPKSLAWYPYRTEMSLLISNSEYKYRLVDESSRTVQGTFLGPTFNCPVRWTKILSENGPEGSYMVFSTDNEIGLQLLPIDGNPYKMAGQTGHPQKVRGVAVSYDGRTLFTCGENDPCVMIWKIRSVDVLKRLGGDGLSPFHCLIKGGKDGWLMNEMKDLFYYAQILDQGEVTTATRLVTDKLSVRQIPNLMRAIGFFPSQKELDIITRELSSRGQSTEEIAFEDFVKLYVNHRPAFGVSMGQLRKAFRAFVPFDENNRKDEEDPVLTREQFLNVLFGKGTNGDRNGKTDNRLFGEPFAEEEARSNLRLLLSYKRNSHEAPVQEGGDPDDLFGFLPEGISYKEFTKEIMGIIEPSPEESRADDAVAL